METKLILAIDPGPEKSAFVLWDGDRVIMADEMENAALLQRFDLAGFAAGPPLMLIEKVESFGMAVGAEVFETVFWSGRFAQMWAARGGKVERRGRMKVKMHHCHSSRAKDSNIRAAILDKYPAGTKREPGPAFGITSHKMAAFALATAWTETGGQL